MSQTEESPEGGEEGYKCIKLVYLSVHRSVHQTVKDAHLKNKVAARDDFVEKQNDAPQHDRDHHNSVGLHCIDNGSGLLDQAQAQLQHTQTVSNSSKF